MRKRVFVDLEETLVRSWDNPVAINHREVVSFTMKHGEEVELFSFAVWDDNDVEKFREKMQAGIEKEFGIKIIKVWPCSEIFKRVRHWTGVQFEDHEVASIWGKERGFEDFCHSLGNPDTEFVLLDDTVRNKTICLPDRNVKIKFVKCEVEDFD